MTRPDCSTIREKISWRHYGGIFLLSLATLLLELALTRVLSVALWYHFGFLVISTALLGFGASGVVLALWQGLREHAALDRTLALLALLLFGGHAIHSFTATMIFGVVLVGTYTSVFIAAPVLIYLGVQVGRSEAVEPAQARPARR